MAQTTHSDHYRTLQVDATASQDEIKQAYRRLAKQLHPDTQTVSASHEQITQLNAAYEVLGDPQQRRRYDITRPDSPRQARSAQPQTDAKGFYKRQRRKRQATDGQLEIWLKQVYNPVDRLVGKILKPLRQEIRDLSADPFDDELMEAFQDYLTTCRGWLEQAETRFRSMPNPSTAAGVAAHLYYCIGQLGDGIDELECFTTSYDDSYLHSGQEMFRIATQLRRDTKARLGTLK